MRIEELVTKQQLEIEELRGLLKEVALVKSKMQFKLHGIGQPMNDNNVRMDNKQLAWCASVEELVEQLPELP